MISQTINISLYFLTTENNVCTHFLFLFALTHISNYWYRELTLFLSLFHKRMLLSVFVAQIWNQIHPHLNVAVHLTLEFSGRGCLARQCIVTKQSYTQKLQKSLSCQRCKSNTCLDSAGCRQNNSTNYYTNRLDNIFWVYITVEHANHWQKNASCFVNLWKFPTWLTSSFNANCMYEMQENVHSNMM